MARPEPGGGAYEAVYVSAHERDALVSCPARMLSERAQGLRVLVVVPFSGAQPDGAAAEQALERLGFEVLRLGLKPAPARNAFYDSFSRTRFERHAQDDALVSGLAEQLTELALQTKARHVYLPLGANSHVDRRLVHDAGVRGLIETTGRNVFFYEERPQALLPGAIRIRLSELGARLPPAAANIRDEPSLARVAFSFSRAPFLAAERLGLLERARATRRVAASYRRARAWNPARAFGLRLQPVIEAMDGSEFDGMLGVLFNAEPRIAELFGSREQLARDAGRYAKRLAGRAYAERYWLLLPPRDEGGLVSVSASSASLV